MSKITRYERSVKNLLSEILPGYVFEKVRPDFLKNPATGRNLELDLYCSELDLFVDVQGPEHRIFPNYISRKGYQSYEDYLDLRLRDEFKLATCLDQGMKVIVLVMPVRKEILKSRLVNELTKLDIELGPRKFRYSHFRR